MNAAMELYKELKIEVLFAPIYSPEYNSIEYFFSWLKREVKKERLRDMCKGISRSYRVLIPLVAQKVEIEMCDKFILRVLRLFKIK